MDSPPAPVRCADAPLAIIGVGANLAPRRIYMRRAVHQLAALPEVRLVARSPVYLSAALSPGQPKYFNSAVCLATALSPEDLLARTQAIEASLGRVRTVRWASRTIDLDLLWLSTASLATDTLVVPHIGLVDRPFALAPLLDVLPRAPRFREVRARYEARLKVLAGAPPVVGCL